MLFPQPTAVDPSACADPAKTKASRAAKSSHIALSTRQRTIKARPGLPPVHRALYPAERYFKRAATREVRLCGPRPRADPGVPRAQQPLTQLGLLLRCRVPARDVR